MTYEQAMVRLEEVTAALEAGELPLDQSLALFSEGAELTALCNKMLDEASARLETLFPPQGD